MEEITTFTRFLDILQGQSVLTLFLIIGMGYLIGGMHRQLFPWAGGWCGKGQGGHGKPSRLQVPWRKVIRYLAFLGARLLF